MSWRVFILYELNNCVIAIAFRRGVVVQLLILQFLIKSSTPTA